MGRERSYRLRLALFVFFLLLLLRLSDLVEHLKVQGASVRGSLEFTEEVEEHSSTKACTLLVLKPNVRPGENLPSDLGNISWYDL